MDKIGCPPCSPHKQSEPQPLPRCSSDMLKRLLSFSRQARFEERQGGSLINAFLHLWLQSLLPCLVCRCVLRGICMQVKLLIDTFSLLHLQFYPSLNQHLSLSFPLPLHVPRWFLLRAANTLGAYAITYAGPRVVGCHAELGSRKPCRIMPHVKTVAYVLLICQSQAPGFMFANNNDEEGLRGFYAASCTMAQTVDFRDLCLCQRCNLTIEPSRRIGSEWQRKSPTQQPFNHHRRAHLGDE